MNWKIEETGTGILHEIDNLETRMQCKSYYCTTRVWSMKNKSTNDKNQEIDIIQNFLAHSSRWKCTKYNTNPEIRTRTDEKLCISYTNTYLTWKCICNTAHIAIAKTRFGSVAIFNISRKYKCIRFKVLQRVFIVCGISTILHRNSAHFPKQFQNMVWYSPKTADCT